MATWRGFVYPDFAIDAHARRIVGWQISNALPTELPLDAFEVVVDMMGGGHFDGASYQAPLRRMRVVARAPGRTRRAMELLVDEIVQRPGMKDSSERRCVGA